MTRSTAHDRMTVRSTTPPTTPRLRLAPAEARRTLLDGGWWPRSADPVAELPGLVLAIDGLHSRVIRLVLAADGWAEHPRRLEVEPGRVVRLGYFASQPTSLLTALCDHGERVDLLVVPPDTDEDRADAALLLSTEVDNPRHAPQILSTVETNHAPDRQPVPAR
ncbi:MULTISPECIES: DUF5994 family protein [Catenuloplanes]|uniref:Uncharacterized protein n=1 Tax=Catenuloplanes niger TaxID=587534 RepID=A0AAE3ZPB3_9ACTN|nr:DUF5994 family protein [Catenuloplanes niger]MDR7322592.1 hypothetical protein [Catenuloplanes niger]